MKNLSWKTSGKFYFTQSCEYEQTFLCSLSLHEIYLTNDLLLTANC